MKITLNGTEKTLQNAATLAELFQLYKLELNACVIEYNNEIIPNTELNNYTLKENDQINIISFVGGG
jgi:thiamine biosynthesis protein ThiS